MLRRTDNGLVTYHLQTLDDRSVVHSIFTRLGGTSQGPYASLNVGRSVGDDPSAVAENLARIYRSLDIEPGQVATGYQVHGNRVAVVATPDGGQIAANTDGLVTETPGLALLLRFADCQPIVLYDPVRHALGLAHAGWRGVAQGMAHRVVEAMQSAFGTRPGDLQAGLGPAIGPCCYTVGDDVASAMGYALPAWQAALHADPSGEGWRLDLSVANAQQLVAAGVPDDRIERADLCTSCHRDEFFSHRGDNGSTGRFALVAFLLPRDPGGIADRRQISGTAHAPLSRLESAGEDTAVADSLQPPGLPELGEVLG